MQSEPELQDERRNGRRKVVRIFGEDRGRSFRTVEVFDDQTASTDPDRQEIRCKDDLIAQVVHQQHITSRGFSHLEEAILRVILYFDVFRHPLTVSEIRTYLPIPEASLSSIEQRLESLRRRSIVERREEYYFLRTTGRGCVGSRREKQRRAIRKVRIARVVASVIRHFPFVRAVILSGELSKGVASEHGDVDFVIVTRTRRLWICRTLLIAFKKTVLFNSRKYFCLNHFVAEESLDVSTRNLYSALEMATLVPMVNARLFDEYLLRNSWVSSYFPNWLETAATGHRVTKGSSLIRSVLESLLPERLGDRIDRWLMRKWQRIWILRYPHLQEAERDHKFQCGPGISTAYGEDFQQKVLSMYRVRLQDHGLPVIGRSSEFTETEV